MSISSKMMAGALGLTMFAGAAIGASHSAPNDEQIKAAIKGRQAIMQLYAYNIGTLAAMAKGERDYDAEAAQAAADNMAAVNGLKMGGVWLPGSSIESGMETRALPAIWESGSDIGEKAAALSEAISGLQAAAGTDLASLRGAIGPVGKACGSCHEDFRQSDD